MLTNWTFDPVVVSGMAAAAILYVRADRRVRRERGAGRFPRARRWEFLTGLAVIGIALESPIDEASSTSFTVHMVQHLLLTMAAAPLLALGAPVTLALLASKPADRRRLAAMLRRPPLRTLSKPLVAWLLFWGVMWGTHFTGMFEASLRSPGLHALEHAAYLGTAVLFWMPVVGRDPSPSGHLSYPGRILYLFAAMASMAFLGLALLSATHVLYPTYAAAEGGRALADQQTGGTLMWIGGMVEIVPALALVMLAWMRADERAAVRIDAQLARAQTATGAAR